MFRKKRLVLIAFLLAAAAFGAVYGWALALAGVGLLVLLLGASTLINMLRANRGVARIEALRATYGVPALLEQARARIPDEAGFRFVVLGDTRNQKKITAMVYERAAAANPAFILHTGDIVRHGTAPEFLENHIALLERCTPGIPMFCVPGNHERGARRDFGVFKALYGDDKFSFVVGDCRFVGINNSTRARVSPGDLAYLDAELGRSPARHKFVFMHIPPVFFEDTFAGEGRRRGFRDHADEMHALFQRHAVTEVFFAHIHGYATAMIDGVRYTLTAGGGAPLAKGLAMEARAYNFVTVDVTPGELRREVSLHVDGAWQTRQE
jgi:predicted phosphodiesterase